MGLLRSYASNVALLLSLGGLAVPLCLACEETPKKRATPPPAAQAVDEPPPPPKPRTAPTFKIDELGPLVGFSRSMLLTPDGQENASGRSQLTSDLAAEKEYISGKTVRVQIDRKANPDWVSFYLKELFSLSPEHVLIETESRPEYPKAIEFVSRSEQTSADPCSLVGTVTEQRATAIWRVSGGTARKRARGMSGPDLTRTADTLKSMFKGCQSDLFLVHASPGVEWGMIYDLAGSGLAIKETPLKRAALPDARPTPGRPVAL